MLDDFLTYHSRLGHSSNTLRSYKTAVQKFLQEFPEFETADKEEIREAVADIFSGKASTYNLRLAAMKSFFTWLTKEKDMYTESPIEDMRVMKIPQRRVKVPTSISIARLYHEDKGDWLDIRNTAIVAVLSATGIRVAELCSIDIGDVATDTITVVGKGNKERVVFLNDTAKKYLHRWLKIRPDVWCLFCAKEGTPLTTRAVALVLEKRSDGLISPHKLRHDFATKLVKKGMPIEKLSKLLGHTSVTTTMRYLHFDTQDLRESYKEFMDD